MPPPAKTIPDSYAQRLKRAHAAVGEATEALQLKRKQRDDLIRESVDVEGYGVKATARASGVSIGRVCAILTAPQDDDQ